MATDQGHPIEWRGGDVPVSSQFDDPYFSLDDGWAESCHVFLAGNELPDRLETGFHVAELGFGTGLNLAVLLAHWHGEGRIRFTSFEAFPMVPSDAAKALAVHPMAKPFIDTIVELIERSHVRTPVADIELVFGDARTTLPNRDFAADAWFLDGFSPAKNPELWTPDLMAEVARQTAPGGSFATYTAAGAVRRALSTAGFDVTRAPGFGRKRHMSRGTLR